MFTDQFVESLASAVASRVAAQITAQAGPQKRLMTIAEAAEYMGRTPKAVEHLITRGTIPVTKLDGKRQIDCKALERLINAHTYFES